jgi:hypothetical protein
VNLVARARYAAENLMQINLSAAAKRVFKVLPVNNQELQGQRILPEAGPKQAQRTLQQQKGL